MSFWISQTVPSQVIARQLECHRKVCAKLWHPSAILLLCYNCADTRQWWRLAL